MNQKAMRNISARCARFGIGLFSMAMLAGSGPLMAQSQPTMPQQTMPQPSMPQPSPVLQPPQQPQQQDDTPRGWRRADDPPPPATQTTTNRTGEPQYQTEPRDQYGAPMRRGGPPMPHAGGQNPPPPQQQMAPPPPQFTIKPGTYVTVRINQPLSSDHNQAGDAFAATLVRPVVVDGFVVAERGETLGGRVVEAQKAGRVQGVSKLGVQLTDLTLVDGQNVPIQTQLISRSGPTSVGRDAAAIGGTTALGAAAGAAADWGRGAAIGAGAGAFVGIVGVLLTRGHPTIIYPEQVLTFRVEAPVTIATERAPQAFRYVEPEDYNPTYEAGRGPMGPRPGPYGYPRPYPYYYAGAYPFYPGFGFYYGPRFYYGRGGYFRGGYRRFR
jgi:hypothetical protein